MRHAREYITGTQNSADTGCARKPRRLLHYGARLWFRDRQPLAGWLNHGAHGIAVDAGNQLPVGFDGCKGGQKAQGRRLLHKVAQAIDVFLDKAHVFELFRNAKTEDPLLDSKGYLVSLVRHAGKARDYGLENIGKGLGACGIDFLYDRGQKDGKAKAVAQRRLDADSIFRRFDPNSTGYIPVSSLGPAFGSSWFQMTKPEMDALIAAFADKVIKDRFWYRKLDQRAAQEQIEPAEMRELLNPSFAEEERDRELGSTLCEIKEKFRMRKKNPEALFAGLDGPTVSYNEFRNRLEDAGIILRWAQEQVLLWRYNGKFGFDWRQFCYDVEAACLIGEPH